MTKYGGCECGAFRYSLTGEAKTVVICHCRQCQRQSGSAFGMSMVVVSDQFEPILGRLKSFTRRAGSGNVLRCFFCPECGTRIYNRKEGGPDVVILKPGTLDDPRDVLPSRQLWSSEKQDWVEFPGLPGFDRQPGF